MGTTKRERTDNTMMIRNTIHSSGKALALALVLCLMLSLCGMALAAESAAAGASALDTADLFSNRDLEQTADLNDAVSYTVADGQDIHITAAGVYVLSGSAAGVTVYVEAGDQDKVQLVLNGVSIENEDFPCIYVKSADKVFVTVSADSYLAVTGTFTADGETNTDGVIFSKDDLTLNGTAELTVVSTDNGIVGKDDLKVTGGSYVITSAATCIEAEDSILIADGTFDLKSYTDGLHAENDDDDTAGYIYIAGGDFVIYVGDDGIHATTVVQIDGGTLDITAAEGIEGSYIQLNGGTIHISSWDDGINGSKKSSLYTPTVEINGGDITIEMSAGDTDGIDCNGSVIVNGGVIDISGMSSFDYDAVSQFNGGTIIVNGQELTTLPNQFMGGGFGGGRGGRWG